MFLEPAELFCGDNLNAQPRTPRVPTAAVEEFTNEKVHIYLHDLLVNVWKGLVACQKITNGDMKRL